MLRKVIMPRIMDDERQTLGAIIVPFKNKEEIFLAKTLELPWEKNLNNISCIPPGEYLCRWTRSSRLSLAAGHDVYTYEVMNVPNRTGIRIHSANYFFQLLGCIAMGSALKDINKDQHLDVIHSGDTVTQFNEIMDKQDFLLVIEPIRMAA